MVRIGAVRNLLRRQNGGQSFRLAGIDTRKGIIQAGSIISGKIVPHMGQVVKSFLILSSQLKIFLFMKNGGQLSRPPFL